ncbi:uncharacterized protein LOC126674063 [Mercurialis annua]|uniref:uncharacterized protein LOC126674063 n=1 Tax=Mercurialis annua TaxID=3986 RepID=UPI0021604E16|nr:uncharacterized protein LOC126674063 [Mercurialis annua]
MKDSKIKTPKHYIICCCHHPSIPSKFLRYPPLFQPPPPSIHFHRWYLPKPTAHLVTCQQQVNLLLRRQQVGLLLRRRSSPLTIVVDVYHHRVFLFAGGLFLNSRRKASSAASFLFIFVGGTHIRKDDKCRDPNMRLAKKNHFH